MRSQGRMPVLFVGHGSPMNAIEDTEFSRSWREVGERIGRPKAILAISAHWITRDIRISKSDSYRQIYDMYGFPKELYEVEYVPDGSMELSDEILDILGDDVVEDNSWGIDHGVWSVLCNMYPDADIPLVVMSAGVDVRPEKLIEVGRKLRHLREEGVLIIASGNVVHNLRRIVWDMDGGFEWAEEFDAYIRDSVVQRDFDKLVSYGEHKYQSLAFTTLEHFNPLLYAVGATYDDDSIEVWNEACVQGSLSMTSYLFGEY